MRNTWYPKQHTCPTDIAGRRTTRFVWLGAVRIRFHLRHVLPLFQLGGNVICQQRTPAERNLSQAHRFLRISSCRLVCLYADCEAASGRRASTPDPYRIWNLQIGST